MTLSHGVMVAQQILVLFVKVRVLMRQQAQEVAHLEATSFFHLARL